MDKSDGSLLTLAFLPIATSLLVLRGTKNDYEIHSPYPGGVLTVATITHIKEYRQGRGIIRNITVSYDDQNKRRQQARLEGNGNSWLRTGHTVEISYLPGALCDP